MIALDIKKKIEKYEKDAEEKAKQFSKLKKDILFRRIFMAWRMMSLFSKTSLYN